MKIVLENKIRQRCRGNDRLPVVNYNRSGSDEDEDIGDNKTLFIILLYMKKLTRI